MAWRAFGHMTGHWVHRGYGLFFFADKATGELLGFAGPWFPEGWPEPELGWSVISGAAEGKGYAFEAASAARIWARDALGWTTAISLIDPANTRSQKLARALGCLPEGPGEVMGKPCTIWRHPALGGLV
ncbi:MAG: GNAT family N-acetyltransferase, partial [Pararhodobacter sp.]